MTTALQRISSKQALISAWKTLWSKTRPKSRATNGSDGVSLHDFDTNHLGNLRAISRQIRNGTYAFSDLRPHFIDKGNGKLRVICIPTTRDRVVQGALLRLLQARYNARFSNTVSYGFLLGSSVKAALAQATTHRKAHPWVFKTDITAFFDRIPREELLTRIKRTIREKSLHELLEQVVRCEIQIASPSNEKKIHQQGIREGLGVRQGMPLSPFFSNLILERFDAQIEKAGLKAVRYADDLIFFADSETACRRIDEFCRESLAEDKLEIPPLGKLKSKSQIYSPTQDADFLGAAITLKNTKYSVLLPRAKIDKILKDFLDLSSIKELVSRRLDMSQLISLLAAKKAGYINAYDMCENLDQLEQSLDAVEQRVLKKIYTEQLGIDLSKLPPVAHRFLGLN